MHASRYSDCSKKWNPVLVEVLIQELVKTTRTADVPKILYGGKHESTMDCFGNTHASRIRYPTLRRCLPAFGWYPQPCQQLSRLPCE